MPKKGKGKSHLPLPPLREDARESQRRKTVGEYHAKMGARSSPRAGMPQPEAEPAQQRPMTGSQRRQQRRDVAKTIQSIWRKHQSRQKIRQQVKDSLTEFQRYGSGSQHLVNSRDFDASQVREPYAKVTTYEGEGDGRKAVQNNFYDKEGKLHYQVDFSTHGGAPSGHWHELATKGDPSSGHGATGGSGEHFPPTTAPDHFHTTVGGIDHKSEPGSFNKTLPGKPKRHQEALDRAIGPLARKAGHSVNEPPAEMKKGYMSQLKTE